MYCIFHPPNHILFHISPSGLRYSLNILQMSASDFINFSFDVQILTAKKFILMKRKCKTNPAEIFLDISFGGQY